MRLVAILCVCAPTLAWSWQLLNAFKGRLASAVESRKANTDRACKSDSSGQLYHESRRPQFHFTAARNWLNDPNGLIYHKGQYHLFFQHNPTQRKWGHMTWAHAVSTDLLHWEQRDNAIEEDDEGMAFSGSAVVDWHNTTGFQNIGQGPPLIAIFTKAPREKPFAQRLAVSYDSGQTWAKLPGDSLPPFTIDLKTPGYDARDPLVRWHDLSKQWVMILGFERGKYRIFGSVDLQSWKPLSDIVYDGAYECPDMFELKIGDDPTNSSQWVILSADSSYVFGDFDGRRFELAEAKYKKRKPRLEYGVGYAAQTFNEMPDGRRVQISWLRQDAGDSNIGAFMGTSFVGAMSFPVEIDLVRMDGSLRVRRKPIRELENLRMGSPLALHVEGAEVDRPTKLGKTPLSLQPDAPLLLEERDEERGNGLEIRVRTRVPLDGSGELRLTLRGKTIQIYVPEESERRKTGSPSEGKVFVKPTHGCMGEVCMEKHWSMPVHFDSDGILELCILADRTIIEIYDTLGGTSMSFYISLPCEGGISWKREIEMKSLWKPAEIHQLDVYALNSTLPPVSPVLDAATKLPALVFDRRTGNDERSSLSIDVSEQVQGDHLSSMSQRGDGTPALAVASVERHHHHHGHHHVSKEEKAAFASTM